MNDNEILKRVKSTVLCLMAHPDNEPNSEFADRIDDLIDIRDELSERQTRTGANKNADTKQLMIADVSHRTWSVDEIIEELKDIDAFDAAKYFFNRYGG